MFITQLNVQYFYHRSKEIIHQFVKTGYTYNIQPVRLQNTPVLSDSASKCVIMAPNGGNRWLVHNFCSILTHRAKTFWKIIWKSQGFGRLLMVQICYPYMTCSCLIQMYLCLTLYFLSSGMWNLPIFYWRI